MSTHSFFDQEQKLKESADTIRSRFLEMHFKAQSGHIGSGLSTIEILTYLYGYGLGEQDSLILSKGHGASALYATLNHFGRLSDELLDTYYQDGTLLAAHPAPLALSEIPAATGSLGHGLPIAVGMAFSHQVLYDKENHKRKNVVCIVSDGECNEGTIWEAALFAGHHKLSNLTVIVDLNGLQGFGKTKDILNLEPFSDKWNAFGFQTHRLNGHDFRALHESFTTPTERPKCLLADTIKGKGIQPFEGMLHSHYVPLKEEIYQATLQKQLKEDLLS